MSARWTIGTVALLSFLYAGTARAQEEKKAEAPKASAAKSSAPKAAAEEKASAHPVAGKGAQRKVPLDAYGKPIRELFIDSKSQPIRYTDEPLKEAFLCHPPPGGARQAHPKGTSKEEVSAKELPEDYVCAPVELEQRVARYLMMTCAKGYCWSCIGTYCTRFCCP